MASAETLFASPGRELAHASRPTASLSAEKFATLLSDPAKAPSWSKWIKKIDHVLGDVYLAQTPEGTFRLAWWWRPGERKLLLRFKYGYYSAEAAYQLVGEGPQARLEGSFPYPPPNWDNPQKDIDERLSAELDTIAKAAG